MARHVASVEMIEAPNAVVQIARKRIDPFVAVALRRAASHEGTLDLYQLAASCYLQGLTDAVRSPQDQADK